MMVELNPQVERYYEREAKRQGYDLDELDIQSEWDSKLSYSENKAYLMGKYGLGAPKIPRESYRVKPKKKTIKIKTRVIKKMAKRKLSAYNRFVKAKTKGGKMTLKQAAAKWKKTKSTSKKTRTRTVTKIKYRTKTKTKVIRMARKRTKSKKVKRRSNRSSGMGTMNKVAMISAGAVLAAPVVNAAASFGTVDPATGVKVELPSFNEFIKQITDRAQETLGNLATAKYAIPTLIGVGLITQKIPKVKRSTTNVLGIGLIGGTMALASVNPGGLTVRQTGVDRTFSSTPISQTTRRR